MTDVDYDKIKALNWSTLKHLAVSPKMLKFREKSPPKDTAALALGRAIHCALLEPEKWAQYVKQPDFGDQRYKENKERRATWFAENVGKITLDPDDYDMAARCAEEIRAHREAMGLIVGGRHEQTIQWVDSETGIKCKARLDNLRPRDISDIKSTRHKTPRDFLRDATNLLYYGQLSWYHDGAVAAGVLPESADLPSIVAAQTCEPYDVMPFRMTRNAYWTGQRLWQTLIKRYADCEAAGWWPGVAPRVLDFDVMPYALTGDDDEQQRETF
jgi:hypothetical protein